MLLNLKKQSRENLLLIKHDSKGGLKEQFALDELNLALQSFKVLTAGWPSSTAQDLMVRSG